MRTYKYNIVEQKVTFLCWLGWTVLSGLIFSAMITTTARAVITISPEEMTQKNRWVQEHLLTASNAPPFSFGYDGKSSSSLLPSWNRFQIDKPLDTNRIQHVLTWSNEVLQVRCVAVEYLDYPAVEWTVYLKNISRNDTPILQDIQGLNMRLARPEGSEFILHCNQGDYSVKESYEPFQVSLNPFTITNFAPGTIREGETGISGSGKSCDGPRGWPYYNLQLPGGGIILAIGWPGQWASSFTRDDSTNLQIKAGQQLTHLYLKPGEEIRTPLIAMLFWQGTDLIRSQNLWRRWYLAENAPRINGELPPITAQGPSDDIPELKRMLEAGIEVDNCWRDAEGKGGTWWFSETGPYHAPKPAEKVPALWNGATAWWNTGTWDVDLAKNPQGFKPFSDWVHLHGLTFMLWFEPERVGNPNSWLAKNHPDWLLPTGSLNYGIHPSFDPILDEGNPEARKWLIDHIDGLIKSQGIDVYREDMNGFGPCPAWRKTDAPDRQGITENFYVQGHIAFWDELRRRNPHLRIDSCASGGRRNDLESMRRGISIGNRTDFMAQIPDIAEGNQGQTYGLSSWLPYQGAFSPCDDTYSYRSFYLSSFGVGAEDKAGQINAYAEWRRIAPFLLGDYYPLTSYSLKRDQWIAWQFDRPELKGGEVQVFRHPESPYDSAHLKLHGLETEANYEVENLDGGKNSYSGRELMEKGLPITSRTAPDSMIFIYKRLE